jgi:cellulose synthase/poly-beta-1,6-N-acetylglucosamine synthase-like glycosyltransferase
MSLTPLDGPSRLSEALTRTRTWLRGLVPVSLRSALDASAFVALVALVVAFGYVQGSLAMAVTLPALLGGSTITVLQAVMACFTVSGLFALSGVILVGQVTLGEEDRFPTSGPTVTAIVPVHRDASILNRSVESLLASQYESLRVVIVAEPDDDASLRRARKLATEECVEVLVNTRYPGSKSGAVNYATEETDSEYVAVFDADERVDPRFVPTAVAKLDDCDVVQGRTIPEPDGFVETVAYYESVVLGDLSQRLLTAVTDFTMAASRTVVMRRTAFEAVDGYDPEMLTEDYAFAFDCYEADLDVVEQFEYASTIEAAHTPADWWGQRKRWMTGYAQVLHSRVTDCLSPRNYRTLLSPLICAGSVLGNLFMLQLVSKAAVLVVNGDTGWMALPAAILVGSALALRSYDAHAGRLNDIGVGYVLMPAVLPLYSLVGIKATVEYLVSWEGEWYSVTKGQ